MNKQQAHTHSTQYVRPRSVSVQGADQVDIVRQTLPSPTASPSKSNVSVLSSPFMSVESDILNLQCRNSQLAQQWVQKLNSAIRREEQDFKRVSKIMINICFSICFIFSDPAWKEDMIDRGS